MKKRTYVQMLINGEVTASELWQVYVKYWGTADWKKMPALRLANYCDILEENYIQDNNPWNDYHTWRDVAAETAACDYDVCIAEV